MTQPRDDHDSPPDHRTTGAGRIPPGESHFLLLEQYAAPSVIVTAEHAIVHVSPTAGQFLHVPSGEPSRDVMKLIVPPLRAALQTALQLAAQGRSPAAAGPVRIAGSDSPAIRVVVKAAPRDEEPPRAYFLVLFEEETDSPPWTESAASSARTSEERLRLLIDSAIDYAIFTITDVGRVASWNSGAERMFGFRVDEILGQDVAILFTPEDRANDAPAEELMSARRTGRASDERWHVRKDGSRLFCSGVTTRLGDGSGFVKIARDLTAQRETETALRESRGRLEEHVMERTTQVTTLLQKMVTAQEAQRARIARDLHDQLGQQLTALRLALERHRDRCAESTEDLEAGLRLVREIDDEIDFLAWELRPAALDDLGLTLALPRFVEEWAAHYGVATHFKARGEIRGRLPTDAEITFYRIAQEALNNVLKHAHASRVDVLLERRDGEIVLVVEDDGIGFDPADAATTEKGMGLIGMRERALLVGGTLDVESSPGAGATVYFRYPVAPGEQSRA